MIEIIPAIDIIGGRCVRLSQGDYSKMKVYGADPYDTASAFFDNGASRLHLVDLDGAKASAPCNLKVLERLSSINGLAIEWGGGIKSDQALKDVLSAGADYAIIGSIAASKPELFVQWLEQYGAGRIVLGADVRNGRIAVKGWMEDGGIGLADMLEAFSSNGLKQVICTEISRDGMLSGPADELYISLRDRFPQMEFTVSGGISSMDDIRRMDALGLSRLIVGKAYYEGRITMEELGKWWQNA